MTVLPFCCYGGEWADYRCRIDAGILRWQCGMQALSVPAVVLNPSNTEATFVQSRKIFEIHLNPVILVLIGKLSLTSLR